MKLVLFLILLTGTFSLYAHAAEKRFPAASYYGASLTPYGVCEKPMKVHEAYRSLREYFHKRGFTVEMVDQENRFLRVDIYRNENHVDRIILDRKTGRMRSIY